ncbi:major facilitator superfamily transporter monocarboxylate [Ilyonectria robusta]
MSGSNTEKPANVGEDNAPLPAALSEPTYDEGGLQGWLVTFGAFCSLFSVFGTINSAGVFESYFATHQLKDKTPSQIGWVFSLYLFITFFVGVQAGPVFDRHGPRMLIAVGSILSIASWMILGECKGIRRP